MIFKLGSVWNLWIFKLFFGNFHEFHSIFQISCQVYIEIYLWTSPLIVATKNVVLDLDSRTRKWKIPNRDSVAENSQKVI